MKKLIITLLALTMVFSLAACGGSGSGGGAAPAAATTTATGDVVTAELPEGWKLVPGEESIGNSKFDFICTSDALDADNFSVLRDTQDMEHYKEMIATGNYGEDLGTAELGEGTWYITDKIAVGPIGEDTCVVQTYGCDLSSAEVQAVLASLKWAK